MEMCQSGVTWGDSDVILSKVVG